MTHAWVKSFLFAIICLIFIDHPPVTVRQNSDQFKPKRYTCKLKISCLSLTLILFWFFDRIEQILCLNSQNDETNIPRGHSIIKNTGGGGAGSIV